MKLQWFEEKVPENIKIKQVYGVIFNENGETLLKFGDKNDRDLYYLAGGTPEECDKDMVATLKREFVEELNTTLKDPVYYLGYQLVDEENGKPPYAQVRMVAMIDKIGEKRPDPDCGKTYGRVLAKPENAIKLLSWGEIGEKIIRKAVKIAEEKFGLDFSKQDDVITSV